jgi:hypothetical protein
VAAAAQRVDRLERQATEAGTAGERLAEVSRRLQVLPGLRAESEALERLAEAHVRRRGLHAQLTEVRSHLASVDQRIARLPMPQSVETARSPR